MELTYCYDEIAKDQNKRVLAKFIRAAAKLAPEFKFEARFNPGGIAVWGEHWVKVTREGQPVVEAIVEKGYTIVRQWDGRNSGRNIQIKRDPAVFALEVRAQAAKPFVRF